MALRKHLSNSLMYCHLKITVDVVGSWHWHSEISSTLEYSSQQVLIAGLRLSLHQRVYGSYRAFCDFEPDDIKLQKPCWCN